MTTLRPLGPRVTLTASASALTPARIALRACSAVDDFFGCHGRSLCLGASWSCAAHFSSTPRMSSSRRMRCSSPSTFTSVPAVLAEEDAVARP